MMWLLMNRFRTIGLALALLAGVGAAARADSVFVSSSAGGKPLEIPEVKILRLDGNMMVFDNNGNESVRPLAEVRQITVDGEDALNAAEAAYVSGDFASAVDGYLKTFRSPSKPWLKDWAAGRLLDSANRSGRFDAAVTAYIDLLENNPSAAQHSKPATPAADSDYLSTAAGEVQTALDDPALNDAQKVALLSYLVELDDARNDKADADKTAGQLDDLLAKDPSNPGAQRAMARRHLVAAQQALAAGDADGARQIIEHSASQFIDPRQQADAMWLLAEAQSAKLGFVPDPVELEDCALAYMRVVAHFKDLDGHPHVVESLLKTAQIEEKLNNPEAARALYDEIVQEYPDDALAQAARQRMGQLGQPH
jgi:TolA-binding protein